MICQQRASAVSVAVTLLLSPVAFHGQPADEMPDLVKVLSSDADTFAKAQACQRLAAVGEAEAVPALAALLPDEQLSAYARSALETIGGPSAAAALLDAVPKLDGGLRIGVVNSLGVIGEKRAVEPLEGMVRGPDADLAAAALAALGRIATPESREVLLWALTEGPAERRPAAAEGCLACARRLLDRGRPADAVKVLYRVRQAEVPEHLRLAAACRTMVARGAAGVPMLREHLRSGDRATWAMTLRAVREMSAPAVTQALVEELKGADPELQVMIIHALAERDDKRAQEAIKEMTISDSLEARLAALKALGPVDDSMLVFVPLFDGETFDGWEGDTEKSFRIEEGAIVGGSLEAPVPRNEFLCTTRRYRNFILRLECKVVEANGGVQFRSERVPDSAEMSGYQADMDSTGTYWGCLYDESRRGMLVQPDAGDTKRIVKKGDWNSYEIRCEGPRIRLLLNEVQTVDYVETDGNIPLSGFIGVQIHGGGPSETWYRNIAIAELP